jgi:hypothetical protein
LHVTFANSPASKPDVLTSTRVSVPGAEAVAAV